MATLSPNVPIGPITVGGFEIPATAAAGSFSVPDDLAVEVKSILERRPGVSVTVTLGDTASAPDMFNIVNYGAIGDGATDDRAAIQSAIDAAGAAGGGTVYIPAGTYLLSTLTISTVGSEAHLHNPYSNVGLEGIGTASQLKATDAYSILYQGKTARFEAATFRSLTGTIAQGASTIALATASQASSFAVGDYIYIRTGQTIGSPGAGAVDQPDAEINRIVTANTTTGVLTLAWPTVKSYAQEYFQSGTSGETSTSVTANPATFGVGNINDRIVTDQWIRNLSFEHTGTGDTCYGVIGGQVLRCVVENVTWRGKTGFQSLGAHRFYTVRGCHLDHPGAAGTYIYTLTADRGCADTTWVDNQITGAHVVSVHIQEGCARVKVLNNTWNCPASTSDVNYISVRSRAYDISIIGNIIANGTPSAIVVDPDCTGGGLIMGNQLLGDTAGYGVFIAVDGWVSDANRHPYGAKFWALGATGVDTEVRTLSGWVTKDTQTATLGTLPANAFVSQCQIQVTEAFNSSGTDTISIGSGIDSAAFGTATDVSTTGLKSVTLGGYAGYSPANHGDIKGFYVNGGTEPTTGKAFVRLQYHLMPEQP